MRGGWVRSGEIERAEHCMQRGSTEAGIVKVAAKKDAREASCVSL